MNKIILITGGARSGKSTFAENLAKKINKISSECKEIAYIATGEAIDDNFKNRINIHKSRRDKIFNTVEEPLYINNMINNINKQHNIFLVECLATWLGNIFHKIDKDEHEKFAVSAIIDLINSFSGKDKASYSLDNYEFLINNGDQKYINEIFNDLKTDDKVLIFVTNEVGFGIIPADSMTREYRDLLGKINQLIARYADYVFLTISGIPMRIK